MQPERNHDIFWYFVLFGGFPHAMGVCCSLIHATAEDSGLLECENVLGEWFQMLQRKRILPPSRFKQ
jgi:hypothetical protein